MLCGIVTSLTKIKNESHNIFNYFEILYWFNELRKLLIKDLIITSKQFVLIYKLLIYIAIVIKKKKKKNWIW